MSSGKRADSSLDSLHHRFLAVPGECSLRTPGVKHSDLTWLSQGRRKLAHECCLRRSEKDEVMGI